MTIAAFAMVGMAAMVGGATGAAMTAVTMIFEMTRDYDIVMPMIVAVAVSIGVRRMLSRENIYTIKLVARRHFIPKALHANMFLIRPAGDIMDKNFLLLPQDMDFDEFLRLPDEEHHMFRHIVVTNGDKIVGTVRVNTSLRRGLEGAFTGVTLGEVAQQGFRGRARRGHHVRRHLALLAQEGGDGGGGARFGGNDPARAGCGGRHHQGTRRRLRGRKRAALWFRHRDVIISA